MYNWFKGKERKNIGRKESFTDDSINATDIWSVYIAKDQYSDKIKGMLLIEVYSHSVLFFQTYISSHLGAISVFMSITIPILPFIT